MPWWDPGRMWDGEDVYVIGGGDSLRTFDWDLIRGLRTIGCNSAFALGNDIIQMMVFGDHEWWAHIGRRGVRTDAARKFAGRALTKFPDAYRSGTRSYGGMVVGCSNQIKHDRCPWLLKIPRRQQGPGLGTKDLMWCGNTGSLAINLALILGAKRVFLLGFDMKQPPGTPNWHDLRYQAGSDLVYEGFITQLKELAVSVPGVFPGSEVVNVTDDSDLPWFTKVTLAEHFKGKVSNASR